MAKYIGKHGMVADGLIITTKLDTGLKSFHLASSDGNMKSWIVRTFQNTMNFESQFFIYGVTTSIF
jgi:hypothetical protein